MPRCSTRWAGFQSTPLSIERSDLIIVPLPQHVVRVSIHAPLHREERQGDLGTVNSPTKFQSTPLSIERSDLVL